MSSYDIFLLTALANIALALIVMACFACTDHCNRPPFPYPGTYLFLQLNTPNSFVFLKFLKLQYPMSHYAVYGSSPIQSMHISGYLFPKLYLNWPDLLIKNIENGKTTAWPKCIRLTHKQAVLLRAALLPSMSESLNPLFYYYRPGMAGPLVLQTASTADEMTDRPTEPSAPAATVDIPLQRLYPVV